MAFYVAISDLFKELRDKRVHASKEKYSKVVKVVKVVEVVENRGPTVPNGSTNGTVQ